MEAEVVVTLDRLWDRLAGVRSLSFVSRSGKATGWNGNGKGAVEVCQAGAGVMTFHEQGLWRPEGGERDIRFRNVYRWTVHGETLRLEHLRFGDAHPVYLFDLAGDREWRSVAPHLCGEDCYAAALLVRGDNIVLRWSVDGPRKQEVIEYLYSATE